MKFTITNIGTERSPYGSTTYVAVADDDKIVRARFPNSITPDKDMLRAEFQADYFRTVVPKAEGNPMIGDVIE